MDKTAWEAAGLTTPTITYEAKSGSSLTDGKAVNAGSYTAKATITVGESTYTATKDFAIDKANLTATVALSGWTYGDTANTPSVTGNSGNGAVTYTYKGTDDADFSATVPTKAGTYKVKASIAATVNYNAATATNSFTIAKKPVTVSGITGGSKTYDGTADVTLNCANATFTGKLEGDTLTLSVIGAFADKNVGNEKTVNFETYVLGGASAANYQLSASGSQTSALANITPKRIAELKVVLSKDDAPVSAFPYEEGKVQIPDVALYFKNAGGEEIAPVPAADYSWETDVENPTDPGTYIITISPTETGNLTEPVTVQYSIVKAEDEENIVTDGSASVSTVTTDAAPVAKVEEAAAKALLAATLDKLPAADKALVNDNGKLEVVLTVDAADEDSEDAVKIKEAAGATIGCFMDLKLAMVITDKNGNTKTDNITEAAKPVEITVTIPDEIANAPGGYIRSYKVLRYHDGVAEVPSHKVGNTLVFSGDKFSVYAIAYTDSRIPASAPSGNDEYIVCQRCGHQTWEEYLGGWKCVNCGNLRMPICKKCYGTSWVVNHGKVVCADCGLAQGEQPGGQRLSPQTGIHTDAANNRIHDMIAMLVCMAGFAGLVWHMVYGKKRKRSK